jgi:hypothetical protein
MIEIYVPKMWLAHARGFSLFNLLVEPVAPLFSDFFSLSQAGLTGLASI